MTLEQHRRRMGDKVVSKISMEKYAIAARCHCKVEIDMDVFHKLVLPNADTVVPADITNNTPVVVALIRGKEAAGSIFEKTKIRGGNRFATCNAEKMQLVYYPKKGKMRVWWTMYSDFLESSDEED